MADSIILPSNRKFGLIFSFIFFLLSCYFYYASKIEWSLSFIILSFIFLFLAIVKPASLSKMNFLWMKFGLLLGSIVSPIVMGVIFFGLFMPLGFLFKILGRDELYLKKVGRESFWWKRDRLISGSFNNQF